MSNQNTPQTQVLVKPKYAEESSEDENIEEDENPKNDKDLEEGENVKENLEDEAKEMPMEEKDVEI